MPPVEIEGYLERKQELQNGGKRATIRSWKTYYTVVCGQLLCFFKDKEGFIEKSASAPPVSLLQAKCSRATDYTKKKHVFRIQLVDGSEFLFMAPSERLMLDWMNKIAFHAALPPSMQLMSYHNNTSPASSQASTPELKRVPPPYEEALKQQKPPIPPRRPEPADNNISVKSRIEMFQNSGPPPPVAPRIIQPPNMVPHSNGNAVKNNRNSLRSGQSFQYSIDENSSSYSDNDHSSMCSAPPPLPQKPPPASALRSQPRPPVPDSDDDWPDADSMIYRKPELRGQNSDFVYYNRQSYDANDSSRHMSLPHKVQPLPSGRPFSTLEVRHRTTSSEGSSEGEIPADRKIKEKKKGGMFGLFKKK